MVLSDKTGEGSQAVVILGCAIWTLYPALCAFRAAARAINPDWKVFWNGGGTDEVDVVRSHSVVLHKVGFLIWAVGLYMGYRAPGRSGGGEGYVGIGRGWVVLILWSLTIGIVFTWSAIHYMTQAHAANANKLNIAAISSAQLAYVTMLYFFNVFLATGREDFEWYFALAGFLGLAVGPITALVADLKNDDTSQGIHAVSAFGHACHAAAPCFWTYVAIQEAMSTVTGPAFSPGDGY